MSTQFNWKSFIYNINNNGVVPVIGNDLSRVKLEKSDLQAGGLLQQFADSISDNGDYITINLYQYLAHKLWDIFGSGAHPKPYTLNGVVLQLQKQGVLENDVNNAIKNEVAQLTDQQIFLDPFKKLAKIPGFDTILTVNVDNFLERAYEAEGLHVNESVNYSIPLPALNLEDSIDHALPKIYNLMGNVNGYNFALTEEQSLEYMYMLQNGIDALEKNLFESIKDKAILLIGCSLPDWFMRFFIRIISKERFKNGIKTKYVACDRTLQDIRLTYFLENNSTKIIRIGDLNASAEEDQVYNDSIEFIDEMYSEWEKNSEVTRAQARFKEKVFLSYSWDDKLLVEKLKNEFEKNGVQVFYDDDELKNGDKYNQVIKKYIKDCDYFLPIITKNAITDKNRYVYDKEWKSAVVLDGYKDESYIRPYLFDETSPTDDRIPEEIRAINIERVSSAEEFPQMVRKFIKENNLTAIEN